MTVQIQLFKQGYITPLDVLEAQIARIEKYKDGRFPDFRNAK